MAARRQRTFLRCPVQSLALLGIEATTVSDVILTHLHYDHVGNFDRFPAARFHLQEREMAYATGRYMRSMSRSRRRRGGTACAGPARICRCARVFGPSHNS